MQQKLSYLTRTGKNLKILSKLYYIKNFAKYATKKNTENIKNIKNIGNIGNIGSTTFVLYGTRIAISPLKRIECNKFFNASQEGISVKRTVRPYSTFQSLIRFSNINRIKTRLKGEVFYQMEVTFINKFFWTKQQEQGICFEAQIKMYIAFFHWCNIYLNPNDFKTKSNQFFPSIITIYGVDSATCYTRYSSFYNWLTKFNGCSEKRVSMHLLQRLQYQQSKLIEVFLYNQRKQVK